MAKLSIVATLSQPIATRTNSLQIDLWVSKNEAELVDDNKIGLKRLLPYSCARILFVLELYLIYFDMKINPK